MRLSVFIVLLFFMPLSGICQFENNYTPIGFTDTIPPEVKKLMNEKLSLQKENAKKASANKKVGSYKCELYEKRCNKIVEEFNDDRFIVDTIVTPYLQKIVDNIYASNPTLKKETKIYAFRSGVPNATSYGEGTIAFNLGLLYQMENESQAAFIICHELAHYHLKHGDSAISKLADLNYDKALEKQINEIKYSSYNRYAKLKELFSSINMDVTKHSRSHENEADSVGLSYLINSPYDANEAVRAMEILDSCDIAYYGKDLDLKKFFDFPQYPFKDSWLEYEPLDFVYASEEEAKNDSNSTHPDCKKRVLSLKRQLSTSKLKESKYSDLDLSWEKIRLISEFETIETYFHYNNLGRVLYHSLILLQRYPDNTYLNAMVGQCLYYIYEFQSRKEFGKVVAFPTKGFEENYNRVLSFLHQLRLSELGAISYNFVASRIEKNIENEDFLFAAILNSGLPMSGWDKQMYIKKYKEKFPNGKYLKFIE